MPCKKRTEYKNIRTSSTPPNDEKETKYFVIHPKSQVRLGVTKENNNARKNTNGKRSPGCKRSNQQPRRDGKMMQEQDVVKFNDPEEEDKEVQELEQKLKEEKKNENNKPTSAAAANQDPNDNLMQWPFPSNLQHVILPSVKRVSFFRDAFFTTPRITHDYRPERKQSPNYQQNNTSTNKQNMPSNEQKQTEQQNANRSKPWLQTRGRTEKRNVDKDSEKASKQDFIRRNIKQVAELSGGRKLSPSPQGRRFSPMPKGPPQRKDINPKPVLYSKEIEYEQLDEASESDMTSTIEVQSESSTECIGRLDEDQSLINFRVEWSRRMTLFEKRSSSIKRTLESTSKTSASEKSIVEKCRDVMEILALLKREMGELYDYFDHFDREEETLLQQIQRDLAEKKKENKILEYKLTKQKATEFDTSKVEELEEELKLSRQVAVSLHWELQRNDEKQNKLEDDNQKLRQNLAASEFAQKVFEIHVKSLQNEVDQMSLHAPSRVLPLSTTSDDSSRNTESEMQRQIQFMKEKEDMMVKRLVDVQTDRDTAKEELQQYRVQFGELAASPATGAGRHTDLKLRLKLAEDHAGLLARKVVELEMQNDALNLKCSLQQQKREVESLPRKGSTSDLQFLEDEVGALRLALDDMERENNRMTTELIALKSRNFLANSPTVSSPIHGGGIVISLSSENINKDSFSLKDELKNASEIRNFANNQDTSQASSPSEAAGNYVRLHPVTYYRLPVGKISSPISPPINTTINLTLDGAWERCDNYCENGEAVRSPLSSGQDNTTRSDTIWNIRPISSFGSIHATTPEELNFSVENINLSGEILNEEMFVNEESYRRDVSRRHRGSSMSYNSEYLQKSQSCENVLKQNKTERTRSLSRSKSAVQENRESSQEHIIEEMKKQIACVRNIAEKMDAVVPGGEDVVNVRRRLEKLHLIKPLSSNDRDDYLEISKDESQIEKLKKKMNEQENEIRVKTKPKILPKLKNNERKFCKKVLDVIVMSTVLYLIFSSLSHDVVMKITFLTVLFFVL